MKRLLSAALVLVVGCSDDTTAPPDSATDLPLADAAVHDGRPPDLGADLEPGPDAPGPEAGADLQQTDSGPPSSYLTARGLIHMHSIYSHDACDGEGFIGGQPNTQCLKELRDSICANTFDFVFLTDHPSNMKDYTLVQDMLHDASAGDQLVLHNGKAIANKLGCANGHRPIVSVGFESKHMMPLGLHALPGTAALYDGITDSTNLATVKQQVAGLKQLGSVVTMVHSEEPDISAATIEAGGFEAMEWYNIHAGILLLLGDDLLSFDPQNIGKLTTMVDKLTGLNDFMVAGGAHPDLAFLLLSDTLPPEGFDKWRTVLKTRHITGMLGSDIHRNVSVDASVCAGALQIVCAGAIALVEAAIGPLPVGIKGLLLAGGTINLSDSDRIDSYDRLMRWLENRVLVKSIDQLELQEALRKGRLYGVFTVFGDPHLFSFTATHAGATEPLEIGDSAAGPLTLEVRLPDRPVQMRGATFTQTEALTAQVKAQLLHTDAAGTQVVATANTLGATLVKQVSAPGAYHVEIRITPAHLQGALGPAKALAAKEYLWVISNPIHVK